MDEPVTDGGVDANARAGSRAVARARITMRPETARAVAGNEMKKGDVLSTARFAGMQAARDTASYVPLLDPEPVRDVTVDFEVGAGFIDVTVGATCVNASSAHARALSGSTVAALTVYDMCKSADRTMRIGPVERLTPLPHDPATN